MTDSACVRPLISVVVPCFDEEDVICLTYRRLVDVCDSFTDNQFEFIFVDDGSRDSTLDLLRNVQVGDSRVRVLAFSRNFGHQLAVTAGLEHAAGDAVVLIDADLQDPPEVIEEMLARWRAGVDVAYGMRVVRQGETHFKRWSAKAFYRFINWVSSVRIPVDTGDFRLMDRKVVDALLAMPERDRFVRGMIAWLGFRQEAVPYSRAARFAGETKYPFRKMIRFATDALFSFSLTPLRVAGWMGVASVSMALISMFHALFARFLTHALLPYWELLVIASLFMSGVQLLTVGILGEYVGRIYGEVKRRPLYVVRERLGFAAVQQVRSVQKERAIA